MSDHGLQRLAGDTEVAGTSEMEVLLGLATGGHEYGAGDQRSLTKFESRLLPHITEQVDDRVSAETAMNGRGCRVAGEESSGEFTARCDTGIRIVGVHDDLVLLRRHGAGVIRHLSIYMYTSIDERG